MINTIVVAYSRKDWNILGQFIVDNAVPTQDALSTVSRIEDALVNPLYEWDDDRLAITFQERHRIVLDEALDLLTSPA